ILSRPDHLTIKEKVLFICIPFRPSRHADGLFTSGYSKLLGQLSAKEYLESLLAKRVSDELGVEQMPVKRHSDAVFTDNYSRLRKKMAAKKYLSSVLSGKRRYGLKRSRFKSDSYSEDYSVF
uniref:Vasoactive intestinal peptide b n=1 Tax=Cyprinus carpio TaxID=7962 RepID=A0A8C2DPQ2_CYPCA